MLIAGLGHGRRVIMYFRTLFYSSFTAESYDSEIRVYMTGTAIHGPFPHVARAHRM